MVLADQASHPQPRAEWVVLQHDVVFEVSVVLFQLEIWGQKWQKEWWMEEACLCLSLRSFNLGSTFYNSPTYPVVLYPLPVEDWHESSTWRGHLEERQPAVRRIAEIGIGWPPQGESSVSILTITFKY